MLAYLVSLLVPCFLYRPVLQGFLPLYLYLHYLLLRYLVMVVVAMVAPGLPVVCCPGLFVKALDDVNHLVWVRVGFPQNFCVCENGLFPVYCVSLGVL